MSIKILSRLRSKLSKAASLILKDSVTRFGEKSALWKKLKSLTILIGLWQNFEPTLTIIFAIRQIFTLMGKYLRCWANFLASGQIFIAVNSIILIEN